MKSQIGGLFWKQSSNLLHYIYIYVLDNIFLSHFIQREIASAIKKLLDAVNEVVSFIPGSSGKQAVEQRKKEFVKYSKKFSTTLKEYFKEGQAESVFLSSLSLVHVTNQIMLTVKSKCE